MISCHFMFSFVSLDTIDSWPRLLENLCLNHNSPVNFLGNWTSDLEMTKIYFPFLYMFQALIQVLAHGPSPFIVKVQSG